MMLLNAVFIVLLQLTTFIQKTVSDSNEIPQTRKFKQKKLNYFWNIPSFQCDSHNVNFTELTDKFGIIQNDNDRFRGNKIAILYDPGSFPALLNDNTKTIRRNGGVPQEGNLTLHLTLFEEIVNELIPDNEFSGVAIIDFESWRPIFRQNFGSLVPYKNLSVKIEKDRHWFWPTFLVEGEATRRFEFFARQFMEETIILAKKLRPKASWGYYAYPYCFNMAPLNMNTECPKEVVKENNAINWLFKFSDNIHPSLYLTKDHTAKQKVQMIQGRINESIRVASCVKPETRKPKILPYFWYKYHSGTTFVSKEDIYNSLSTLSASEIDGVILWGSSNDVNSKSKCSQLYDYVDTILGPSIINT